jgi:hypothetical protein
MIVITIIVPGPNWTGRLAACPDIQCSSRSRATTAWGPVGASAAVILPGQPQSTNV